MDAHKAAIAGAESGSRSILRWRANAAHGSAVVSKRALVRSGRPAARGGWQDCPRQSDTLTVRRHRTSSTELCRGFFSAEHVGHTGPMTGWIGLIGALAGAAIAMAGQYLFRLLESRRDDAKLFLEQCAQVVALEEDFRNRIWEERHLNADSVREWNLRDAMLATARLRIISTDREVLRTLEILHKSGQELGKVWRTNKAEGDDLTRAWQQHRRSLDQFVDAVRPVSQALLGIEKRY